MSRPHSYFFAKIILWKFVVGFSYFDNQTHFDGGWPLGSTRTSPFCDYFLVWWEGGGRGKLVCCIVAIHHGHFLWGFLSCKIGASDNKSWAKTKFGFSTSIWSILRLWLLGENWILQTFIVKIQLRHIDSKHPYDLKMHAEPIGSSPGVKSPDLIFFFFHWKSYYGPQTP